MPPGVVGGVKDGESNEPGNAGVAWPLALPIGLGWLVASPTGSLVDGKDVEPALRERSPRRLEEGGDCGTREGEAWDGKVGIARGVWA